jgi:hypothetical protein
MQDNAQRDPRRRRNRRRHPGGPDRESRPPRPVSQPSGFSKFLSIITFGLIGGAKKKPIRRERPVTNVTVVGGGSDYSSRGDRPAREPRAPREPMAPREVTSERLHVGNLSFDAAESDLFELFSGVGSVKNAEIVVNKHNQRSKGFGFITMANIDEAKRAVAELNNKDFMGRSLIVGGAKPPRDPRHGSSEDSSES